MAGLPSLPPSLPSSLPSILIEEKYFHAKQKVYNDSESIRIMVEKLLYVV